MAKDRNPELPTIARKERKDVTNKESPKLVVAYDRSRNECAVVAHNQTPEAAQSYLDQWSRHLRPESSFVVIDQTKPHQTEDAQKCRACRETVVRSAQFQPQPAFERRQK